jgi:hypothetical protein
MTSLKAIATVACVFSAILAACSSSDSDGAAGGSQAGSGGSGKCYNVTVNAGTGDTTCAAYTCHAGEHCDSGGGVCFPGCLAADNCAHNEYCDGVSGATGTCHAPTAANEVSCGTGGSAGSGGSSGCPDVHGAYTISKDASSSQGCPDMQGTECTVSQSGCSITMPCGGATFSATLDQNGKGTSTMPGMGTCAVTFDSSGFTADCQASGVNCVYNGPKK